MTLREASQRMLGGFKKGIDLLDRVELILIFVAGAGFTGLTIWMLASSIWAGFQSGDWIAILVSTLVLAASGAGVFLSIKRGRLHWLAVPVVAAIGYGAFRVMYW